MLSSRNSSTWHRVQATRASVDSGVSASALEMQNFSSGSGRRRARCIRSCGERPAVKCLRQGRPSWYSASTDLCAGRASLSAGSRDAFSRFASDHHRRPPFAPGGYEESRGCGGTGVVHRYASARSLARVADRGMIEGGRAPRLRRQRANGSAGNAASSRSDSASSMPRSRMAVSASRATLRASSSIMQVLRRSTARSQPLRASARWPR